MRIAAVILIVLAGISLCAASPITRIDIYDKADNHLLFVTFEYDVTGKNTGRNVFASDSTFLRTTTFQSGGTGYSSKEASFDFLGNPSFFTTIGLPVSGTTTITTVDQFGLSQFGAPLTWRETSTNNYDISQETVLASKERYEFGANGELNRITVLDKNGATAWYAHVSHQTTAVLAVSDQKMPLSPLVTVNNRVVRIRFDLAAAGHVRAELFTATGRMAAVLVDKNYGSGRHVENVPETGMRLGNAAYIIRITINGSLAKSGRLLLLQ
ncbi:MAG: hypothetical protein MUF22_00895 [Chitinispirillaceae bacterium]|jgi:hypothetical protein|nr:hypothetical protein [Chitinispirillaceae bacterium]